MSIDLHFWREREREREVKGEGIERVKGRGIERERVKARR